MNLELLELKNLFSIAIHIDIQRTETFEASPLIHPFWSHFHPPKSCIEFVNELS